ncbi:type II secretion system protein N [Ferrimonas gelatinilytica]|uniref:Type II secretion system protein N n=1 Tax=Ferrimonas gelatinilytica TaxID=1255257 RepID=A0ABP9SAY8_9GAMM
MRVLKYGLAGVGIYLVFLLVTMPAAWVWQMVPKMPGVELRGISGSLWQGQAAQFSAAGRQLEQLSWTLHPAQLITGNLALSLTVNDPVVKGQGELQYGFSGLQAQGVRLSAPIPWLLGNTRLPLRTKIQGAVTLNLRELAQGEPWCEALAGRTVINGLDVRNQFGHYPIGDIAGNLICRDGNAVLNLDAAENRIGVAGEAVLMAGNQVKVEATIRETEEQSEDLRQALTFLGQPDSSGAYSLNYNGPVPGL